MSAHFGAALSFLAILGISTLYAQHPADSHRILYTGNLNCALDDCHCGSDRVGGMTRILQRIREIRSQEPEVILLDSGDLLGSYPAPAANQVMLMLAGMASYDAMLLGDQEFVEGVEFLEKASSASDRDPPFLSANIRAAALPGASTHVVLHTGQLSLLVIGLTDPEAFSFIEPGGLDISSPLAGLAKLRREAGGTALQILLYHGSRDGAATLLRAHPWIDVIILSHQQERREERIGATILVEPGNNGEYLGSLEVRRIGGEWRVINTFIEITREMVADATAQYLVDRFYSRAPGSGEPH